MAVGHNKRWPTFGRSRPSLGWGAQEQTEDMPATPCMCVVFWHHDAQRRRIPCQDCVTTVGQHLQTEILRYRLRANQTPVFRHLWLGRPLTMSNLDVNRPWG